MSEGIVIETVDLDVFDSIRLLIPGEHCPHCHGSGKSVHYSKSHGDRVYSCSSCYGGLVAFPVCECGDWQHQHEGMIGKCLLCENDRRVKPFAPCSQFRFAWNERPMPGTGKVVAVAFWEMWDKYGVAAAPMPCGHPREAVASSGEGTNYCGMCAEAAAAKDEIQQ